MTERLSIVISIRNRTELFRRSLTALCCWQRFEPNQAELVVVSDDKPDEMENLKALLEKFSEFFYQTQLIEVDSKKSEIPIFWNNPALWMNVAIKAAENDAIYKTDPECLPITETVRHALELYHPDTLQFFATRLLTKEETADFTCEEMATTHPEDIYKGCLVSLPDLWFIDRHHPLPYWYGALFSKSRHMAIGGLDEEFLRGFAGEDDDWAERMQRSGAEWRWSNQLKILHQFHGTENMKLNRSPEHMHNVDLLKLGRMRNKIMANDGRDWGSDSVVVNKTVFAGQQPADQAVAEGK